MISPIPDAQAHEELPRTAISPERGSQRLVLGFALIIAIGTVLLRLPIATHEPISWLDALFTSTSAVTVTGLTLFGTATHFTLFGQLVILLLLQVGGIGFIAISVVLFQLAGRRVGLHQRLLLRQTLGMEESSNLVRLTGYVLGMVLVIEFLGAFLLFIRWVGSPGMSPSRAAYLAIFHAISAFCNAGFDLYAGTSEDVLFGYGRDPYTLFVLAMLITVGGFGIVVVDDLLTWWWDRRLSVHTRLTLLVSLVLTCVGVALFLLDEQFQGELIRSLPWHEKLAVSIFTIVSSRTAGVTILPLEELSEASSFVLMVWMFIGGAPSSMAGGVSTSTIGVIAIAMLATVSGRGQAVAFGRAMPTETILKAMAVMTVSTLLVAIGTLLLSLMHEGSLIQIGFEVISAFSNTGYSLAFTGELSPIARALIAFIMFWGRLGPLTLVVVLAQRQRPTLVTYPDERVILG